MSYARQMLDTYPGLPESAQLVRPTAWHQPLADHPAEPCRAHHSGCHSLLRLVGSACLACAREGLPAPGQVPSQGAHVFAASLVLLLNPGFPGHEVWRPAAELAAVNGISSSLDRSRVSGKFAGYLC